MCLFLSGNKRLLVKPNRQCHFQLHQEVRGGAWTPCAFCPARAVTLTRLFLTRALETSQSIKKCGFGRSNRLVISKIKNRQSQRAGLAIKAKINRLTRGLCFTSGGSWKFVHVKRFSIYHNRDVWSDRKKIGFRKVRSKILTLNHKVVVAKCKEGILFFNTYFLVKKKMACDNLVSKGNYRVGQLSRPFII